MIENDRTHYQLERSNANASRTKGDAALDGPTKSIMMQSR